jgi:hypothetical protein
LSSLGSTGSKITGQLVFLHALSRFGVPFARLEVQRRHGGHKHINWHRNDWSELLEAVDNFIHFNESTDAASLWPGFFGVNTEIAKGAFLNSLSKNAAFNSQQIPVIKTRDDWIEGL